MFKEQIIKLLKKQNIKNIILEIPPSPELGDYAFPCFSLSKQQKQPPQQIALELSKRLTPTQIITKIQPTGPYINFFINKNKSAEIILKKILKEKDNYGKTKSKKQTIMVEYPSPNTNKPLHLGHLRNISIGDSISNILEFQNNKIIRTNLNNDRGVHISKSMLAYQKWGNNKKPNKKSDHFVGDFYVLFSKNSQKNPNLEQEAQDLLKNWEQKDKETVRLSKKMNSWALEGFKETYKKFNVKPFNKTYYESQIYKKGKQLVLKYLKKGIFKKRKDNAIIINLKDLGEKVLLRPNGTTVYITQDLCLAQLKSYQFNLDKSIYVVGNEQDYHFQVLFKILKLLGLKSNFYHLSYGMIFLPEGKMKSREGIVVDADNIIQEMQNLAKKEIQKRNMISKIKIKKTSHQIALAAIRYFMLKQDIIKDIYFNPKESISLEGDTGPYLQYTHARANSILKKVKHSPKFTYKITTQIETEIIKKLQQFPELIEKSTNNLKPNLLANYIHELAQLFNEFYHSCPVIKEPNKDIKNTRVSIVKATKQVLNTSLNLLGITPLNQM